MGRMRYFNPQAGSRFDRILMSRFALGLVLCSLFSSVSAGLLLKERAVIHKDILIFMR